MYKNLLKSITFAALALVAGACAKEQVASGDGETVEMTFNVDVPETTITTKGLSDAAQVDELVFDAFRAQNDTKPIEGLRQVVAVKNSRATIQVKLIKGQNYRFVFWAQKANNGYYNTDNLSNITVDYSKALANDSSLDAFFAKEDVTNVQNPISKTIILKRPFAQVNYVTKEELSEGLYIKESQITVKNALTSFNPLRNKLSGEQDVTFQFNAVPTEKLLINGTEYNCLATAFILAKSDNSNDIVDVEAKFKANKGYSVTVSTPGLPCQRNYRTNVIGNFMSVDGTYNIEIDSAFKGDLQTDYVANALSSGQVVTLTDDYSLPEGSGGVAVYSGKTSVLNLNGKKFSNENGYKENKAALQVHGDLTINGDGEVYCEGGADNNAIIVEQGGHLVINGGKYNVGANTNSGKSNATIFVMGPDINGRSGSVEINGGVFMAEAGNDGTLFVLNQHDDITVNCFSVKGGTFVGFNPASVNEAHGAITSFVAEGYKSVKTTYEGKQAWKVEAIPAVTTQEAFNTAIATANSTVVLAAGTDKLPKETVTVDGNEKSVIAEGVTIIGNGEGTVLNTEAAEKGGEGNYNAKGLNNVTFKNLTINEGQGNYNGIKHSGNIKYEKCVILGRPTSYATNVEYKDCTFKQTTGDYNIWTYASNITFDNCVFDCQGKAALVYREGNDNTKDIYLKVTFNKCVFKASAKVTGKAAIEIDSSRAPYEVYINNCTSEGFDNGTKSGNSLWNNKKGDATNLKVVVDSVPQTLN